MNWFRNIFRSFLCEEPEVVLAHSIESSIPAIVKINAVCFKLIDVEGNLSKGEIEKFNYVESQKNSHKIGDRVSQTLFEGDKEFESIWVHVGRDYFKCLMKV